MTIAHELARKFGKNLPPPNMLVLESGSLIEYCSEKYHNISQKNTPLKKYLALVYGLAKPTL